MDVVNYNFVSEDHFELLKKHGCDKELIFKKIQKTFESIDTLTCFNSSCDKYKIGSAIKIQGNQN